MTQDASGQMSTPQGVGWVINDFAASTPGVSDALLVSSDGLTLLASTGLGKDLSDPLSAATSGLLSLANDIGIRTGRGGCDQVLLRLEQGNFLFMGIGQLAGLAVLVEAGANLGAVAHRMAQLVDSVGHALTPQLRNDLRNYAHELGGTS